MVISFQIFHSSRRRWMDGESEEAGERKAEKKMLEFTQWM
jgi:hypothetical protein